MRTRPFYLLSCAFAVVAGLLEYVSKVDAHRAATSAAMAVQAPTVGDRQSLTAVAHQAAVRSERYSLASTFALLLTTAAWAYSYWRRERALQSIPFVLVLLVEVLQYVLV